jgi:hypothetical protein
MGKVQVFSKLSVIPLRCFLNDTLLKKFHGNETEIGRWEQDEHYIVRTLRFPLDASGSPLTLGNKVYARVKQSFDGKAIRNTLSLDGLGDLLRVQSTWRMDNGGLHGEAMVRVGLPRPFRWIVEKYVDARAEKQMQDFVTCACIHSHA